MTARAPKPGAGRRIAISEEMAASNDAWITVVCERDGKEVTLRQSAIGPSDEQQAKAEAGVSIWDAMRAPTDITSIAAVYWMARRKNGERDLTFRKVIKTFPNIQAIVDAGIEMYVGPDDDADEEQDPSVDPTPSGPASATAGPASLTTSASTPGT